MKVPGAVARTAQGRANAPDDAGDGPARKAGQGARLTDELSAQEQAVRVTPGSASLWHQLGKTRERLGMPEAARAAYEEAVRLDPDDGAHSLALVRMDFALHNASGAQARLMSLEPHQLADPAAAEECVGLHFESGNIARAFELLDAVRLVGTGVDLRLAASCLAGGRTKLASMFFDAATEPYYYRVRGHCGLLRQARAKVELSIATAPLCANESAWETRFEIDRGRARITFSREFGKAERRMQIIALRRASQVAPLFWGVWPLRRKAQQFPVSLRDTGLTGHFSFCGTDGARLIPDTQFLGSFGYEKFRQLADNTFIPWPDRRLKILWRGGANGFVGRKPRHYGSQFEWNPRINLCATAHSSRHSDIMDLGITGLPPPFRDDPIAERRKLEKFIREPVPAIDQMQYQYLIDIDGWANSWSGLFQKLLLGAAILKVQSPKGFKQWYYDRMLPFETYLPVNSDLSDLDDIVAWAMAHPKDAERIAQSGRQLASSLTFSREFAAAVHRIAEQNVA